MNRDTITVNAVSIDSAKVLVKSFPNDPIMRCILNESVNWVELCMEDEFKQWMGNGVKPLAVRCPKSRVYSYDPDLYARLIEAAYILGNNQLLRTLWKQAKHYYQQ